jgi:mRNA-degrading endonuclease RelE of RelBE toxin-antitoxin system
VRQRFKVAFERLSGDPFHPRAGLDIRPLVGTPLHRLRIGRFRGIYEVIFVVKEGRVIFTCFEHRKRSYR